MSKVYILLDNRNRVLRLDGGYSIQNVDLNTWIQIDEGEGDKYNLCQSHYLDGPLYEEHGIPRYAFINGVLQLRTKTDIDADIAAIPVIPSAEEKLEAQVMYTALMTDTLIEEV